MPLPVLSLLLPLAAAFLPLGFYIFKRIKCWHKYEKCVCEINLRFLKIFFLAVLTANLLLTWSVWTSMGTGGTEMFVLSSGGWSQTLSPDSPMLIKAVLQVDVFGAMSAFLMGCVALIAGLAAMADKNDTISLSKVSFFSHNTCRDTGDLLLRRPVLALHFYPRFPNRCVRSLSRYIDDKGRVERTYMVLPLKINSISDVPGRCCATLL